MGYLVGTDEAGYAPNLGPLVISATVWHVPGDPRGADLYKRLRKAVAASPSSKTQRARRRPSRVAMADSKVLYRAPEGLELLELGLLVALELMGPRPTTWRQAWNVLDPDCSDGLESCPWHVDYSSALPLEADGSEVERLGRRLRDVAAEADVRLLSVRSRAVFPDRWNVLTDRVGNKGTALSLLTLELLTEALKPLGDEPVAVICDKHGGRNCYRALLQQHVADWVVEVYGEARDESVYRWGPTDRKTEVLFCTKAERFLPAALASMASKYLRELSMRAFNDYWRRHVPDLAPTAGYPSDAGRFRAQIAAAQSELGIDDHILWRKV